ncbi:hypothetical protein IWW48_001747 [Coemansia sp. RSA 1200]|nr:hypothetical protein IWW48_001747 [Coemansia sp. RSA 1200]
MTIPRMLSRAQPLASNTSRTGRMLLVRTMTSLRTNEIRHRFIKYFVKHGHVAQRSAPIVPATNDSTLLFTNAGMVPHKQHFQSPQTAPKPTVTSIQKCVRAGGKHNDLDQVGHTARHHTFFEMLGNFSFGAYNKRRAIELAWGFVRQELAMPAARLRVSVLRGDDEAYSVWRDDIKLDSAQIVQLGEDDNFWSMGHGEGPCGPCSEIFWDTQARGLPSDHADRWLEFWNLVFMQYYRDAAGRLVPLERPCIDTGMGLERVASILQGVHSNFETDELRAIVDSVGGSAADQTSRRIIADHLRASAFLIAEGVQPASTGRGYVLRRIIRRAMRAGRQLGIRGPVLAPLYPSLEAAMGAAYPELATARNAVVGVLEAEETAFLKMLDNGLALLERRLRTKEDMAAKVLCAEDVFVLYDTHGFPADLTQAIARDRGWAVDIDGFETLLQRSRQQNRERSRGELGVGSSGGTSAGGAFAAEVAAVCAEWQRNSLVRDTRFCGYDLDPDARDGSVPGRVVASRALSTGDLLVALDPSPFYTAGGGQDADTGTVSAAGAHGVSYDVKQVVSPTVCGLIGVLILTRRANSDSETANPIECLDRDMSVVATVDMKRRRGCAVHHTATHLLNNALRTVVGDGVVQAGSQVRAQGLRFDFSSCALTSDQLKRIASAVNRAALAAMPVTVAHMTLADAQTMGALSVRAERQCANSVRVVTIADAKSVELCGGTHLRTTRGVFPFQIVAESSVGAGTRRIEAVAGDAAVAWLQNQLAHARRAAAVLGAPSIDSLESRVRQLDAKSQAARDEADRWLRVAAAGIKDSATLETALRGSTASEAPLIPTRIHVLLPDASLSATDSKRLVSERAIYLRTSEPTCAHVVVCGGAISLGVDPAALPGAHAGNLLRLLLADLLPGRGGGQDTLAHGRLNAPVVDPTCIPAKLGK